MPESEIILILYLFMQVENTENQNVKLAVYMHGYNLEVDSMLQKKMQIILLGGFFTCVCSKSNLITSWVFLFFFFFFPNRVLGYGFACLCRISAFSKVT